METAGFSWTTRVSGGDHPTWLDTLTVCKLGRGGLDFCIEEEEEEQEVLDKEELWPPEVLKEAFGKLSRRPLSLL